MRGLMRVKIATWLLCLAASASATSVLLTNDVVRAEVDPAGALLSLTDLRDGSAHSFADGGWQFTQNFYAEVGYGFVGLGGGVSGQDLIVLVTDFQGDPDALGRRGRALDYSVESSLHMLDLEVGWEWFDFDPWVFRTGIGLAWTLVYVCGC